MNPPATGDATRPFVISRLLDAPRDCVWQTWTDQARMEWCGPKGTTFSRAEMDFRPGGRFHYCMLSPDGKEMWGKWLIREVVPPARLVFVNCFSDAAGGTTRHPLSATWPLETLSTITLTEQGNQTLLTIEWLPINATEEEIKTFDGAHEGMRGGWTGSLDRLVEYLAKR
jgi:uncharacterized protein YndB with AHSA1/START domain